MQHTDVYVRPRGASLGSAFLGWVVALGVLALAVPLAVVVIGRSLAGATPIVLTIPFLVALAVAYLIGGYAAGRLAGYRTGLHGLMTAIVGLLVALPLTLIASAVDASQPGGGATMRWIADNMPSLGGAGMVVPGYMLTVQSLAGIVLMVICAWLGGLVAATAPVTTVVSAPASRRRIVERHVQSFGAAGAKGGEREDETRRPGPEL